MICLISSQYKLNYSPFYQLDCLLFVALLPKCCKCSKKVHHVGHLLALLLSAIYWNERGSTVTEFLK